MKKPPPQGATAAAFQLQTNDSARRAAPQASPPLRLIVNHSLERLIAARHEYVAARRAADLAGQVTNARLWAALGELADARRAWLSRRPSPAALVRWLWRLEP